MSNPLITRKQYMENSSELHHAYYAQFITDGTRAYVKSRIGIDKLMKSNDKYFNDLGIKHTQNGAGTWVWDFAPVNIQRMRDAGECGVGYLPSQSAVTCTAKACARMLVLEEKAKS
jgi:hypothetical protein